MNVFRTISTLLLTALVLMASSSFYVGVHYCGGTVKAMAFLQEADGCGHQELPPCHRKAMEGCCTDEQVMHESQELKTTTATLILPTLASSEIIHSTRVIAEIIPDIAVNPAAYLSEQPPALTGHDIIISIQSFLL
jgi:hypothetical protein